MLFEQRGVRAQQIHRLHQLRAESKQIPFAQKPLAHAIDSRQFFLPRDFFFRDCPRVRLERCFLRFVLAAQPVNIALVIIAASPVHPGSAKKMHKIIQEFSGIGQPPEMVQLQLGDVPPQQYLVV